MLTRRSRARCHGEAGVTLVELMVVSALLLVTGGIVTTGVLSAHRVTRHAESRIQAVTSIHQAVAGVSREIRAADSRDLTAGALGAASPTRLETDVLRGDPGQRMRFTYTVADGALTERRRTWAAGADVTNDPPASDVSRTLLTDLVTDGPRPLFGYHTADGSCLTGCTDEFGVFVDGAVPEDDLSRIAEVRLTVRRTLGDGRSPIEVVTRITLRNA